MTLQRCRRHQRIDLCCIVACKADHEREGGKAKKNYINNTSSLLSDRSTLALRLSSPLAECHKKQSQQTCSSQAPSHIMKCHFLSISVLFAVTNAEISFHSTDLPNLPAIPSGLQSLINSVESRASSAAGQINSIVSNAATALPSQLLSKAIDILPVETAKVSTSGATAGMGARSWSANGAVGAAVAWYMVN